LYFGLFVASAVPLTLIYLGFASRLIGIALVVIFGVYTYRIIRKRSARQNEPFDVEARQVLRKHTSLALLSAAIVVVASYFIVDSSSYIAVSLGIPHVIVGGTIVAFGTSISVLLTSVRAVQKGHSDLALGNIVGTCFINTTLILGATLMVSSLRVDMTAFSSLVMFSVIANLFLWYFLSGENTSWREGTVLLFMYFLFLIISFGGYKQ